MIAVAAATVFLRRLIWTFDTVTRIDLFDLDAAVDSSWKKSSVVVVRKGFEQFVLLGDTASTNCHPKLRFDGSGRLRDPALYR